ncbi:MAG: hypothetical protein ACPG77_04010, partial [Nannocystaceae bacterium]
MGIEIDVTSSGTAIVAHSVSSGQTDYITIWGVNSDAVNDVEITIEWGTSATQPAIPQTLRSRKGLELLVDRMPL